MRKSLGVFRHIEGAGSPIEKVNINPAVARELRGVTPRKAEPTSYVACRLGISSGEQTGPKDTLRVISPTGRRAQTLRFFPPTPVGNPHFTSLTAKGVGIGDTSVEPSEELFGLLGNRAADKELKVSEGLQRDGVRVSRVAATVPLDGDRLRRWFKSQPKGPFRLEQMLEMLQGEQPEIVVRFDNPRLSDLFNANESGPYSAYSIARRGAHALHTEFDMSSDEDHLGAKYGYSRSIPVKTALREIISKGPTSPDALKEYLRLEAFFAGYNHMQFLHAGGRLQTVRAPQDILVGGAIFTDFESTPILKGTLPNEHDLMQQGASFSQSFARMITQRGYKSLGLIENEGADRQSVEDAFLEGYTLAA